MTWSPTGQILEKSSGQSKVTEESSRIWKEWEARLLEDLADRPDLRAAWKLFNRKNRPPTEGLWRYLWARLGLTRAQFEQSNFVSNPNWRMMFGVVYYYHQIEPSQLYHLFLNYSDVLMENHHRLLERPEWFNSDDFYLGMSIMRDSAAGYPVTLGEIVTGWKEGTWVLPDACCGAVYVIEVNDLSIGRYARGICSRCGKIAQKDEDIQAIVQAHQNWVPPIPYQ